MTYSRGQYDDGYGRDRRPRRDAPEYGERRAGSGSSRYSRSSERYARHASDTDNRNEGRTARSQSRTDWKRRDDAQQARRRRGRMAGTIPLVMPRGRQRVQGNATACVTLHMIVATSVVAGSVTREAGKRAMPMRVRVQVSATSPQANQYSRDRYVSQPGQQRGASVSQQNYAKARRVKPVDPRALLAAAVIAVVLAVVIIVRFVLFGGTASEYGVAKAAIDQQQSQLTELQTSNEDLQAQIDSMQGLIERYDNSGKK